LSDSLIQRLQHARIHRSDDIHRRVQFFVGHPGFPCVRKAPFYSRIAQSHHRHSQADEHLLSLAETFDGMSVTIESAKISFLQRVTPFGPLVSGLESGKIPLSSPFLKRGKDGEFETPNLKPDTRNQLI
jgi:hypothetical protein